MEKFESVCDELLSLLKIWEPKLLAVSENALVHRTNSQNRTIKQIVGHMIDSASNNTHRIIHLQYDKIPSQFPDYANFGNNDKWIAIQNFQKEDWHVMVQLWKYCHTHIVHVIKNVDPLKLENEWISALGQKITLEAMIIDFPRHFQLHIKEIEELLN